MMFSAPSLSAQDVCTRCLTNTAGQDIKEPFMGSLRRTSIQDAHFYALQAASARNTQQPVPHIVATHCATRHVSLPSPAKPANGFASARNLCVGHHEKCAIARKAGYFRNKALYCCLNLSVATLGIFGGCKNNTSSAHTKHPTPMHVTQCLRLIMVSNNKNNNDDNDNNNNKK